MVHGIPVHPFEHFRELDQALNRQRGWFESAVYLRYAAMAAVPCDGDPYDLARAIRETADQLKRLAGWFGDLRSEIRFAVAALLNAKGDSAGAFHAEVQRVRKLFRGAGLPRDATYEILAVLVLRSGLEGRPIEVDHARRVKEMYAELKMYHRWLTDSGDFPACAILSLRPEPTALMAQRIEQLYEGLRAEGFARGNELQSSACLLYLSEGRAEVAARRAGVLVRRFKDHGVTIRRNDYDEVALLAFLLNDPEEIIARVLAYRDEARRLKPRPDKHVAFNIGANLAMLDLMRADQELLAISQVKLIVDVQAVVAAHRAAAAVVVAAAAS